MDPAAEPGPRCRLPSGIVNTSPDALTFGLRLKQALFVNLQARQSAGRASSDDGAQPTSRGSDGHLVETVAQCVLDQRFGRPPRQDAPLELPQYGRGVFPDSLDRGSFEKGDTSAGCEHALHLPQRALPSGNPRECEHAAHTLERRVDKWRCAPVAEDQIDVAPPAALDARGRVGEHGVAAVDSDDLRRRAHLRVASPAAASTTRLRPDNGRPGTKVPVFRSLRPCPGTVESRRASGFGSFRPTTIGVVRSRVQSTRNLMARHAPSSS